MALYSRLPSGGASASRSTRLHTGSKQCANNTDNVVFELVGGGKLNKMMVSPNVNIGSGGTIQILIDGTELFGSISTSSGTYYLFRNNRGVLELSTSYSSATLPLDIEFKKSFAIVAHPTNNGPTITYDLEISSN